MRDTKNPSLDWMHNIKLLDKIPLEATALNNRSYQTILELVFIFKILKSLYYNAKPNNTKKSCCCLMHISFDIVRQKVMLYAHFIEIVSLELISNTQFRSY